MGIINRLRFKKVITLISLFYWLGIFHGDVKAQQMLNLDFETLSIEGISRPWIWDFETYSETQVSLDSTVKHHGKYSLKIWAEESTNKLIFSHFLEPFELANNEIKISGWVKTESLNGNANFIVRYTLGGDTSEIILKSEPVSKTQDWQKVVVMGQIPDTVATITVSLQHEGTGTVWFDDFKLFINGKPRESIELALGFTESQLEWIGDHSTPIHAKVPLNIQDENLSAFKSLVNNASIIALGESTHGTREFFQLKHRLLKYSVEELGVRVFAIEDHQLVVRGVNKYVMGGEGTARSSMYGMLGVWQTKEVHDLIEWIRKYNDLHPSDKVEFVGFDIQNHSLAIDSLYTYLDRRIPDLLNPVKTLLKDLKANGAMSYSVSDSVKLNWYVNSQKVLKMVSEQTEKELINARSRTDSLDINWGLQYANLIKQFAEHTYKGHESLYRDIAMAENVSWIQKVYKPECKILIWAHDVHISRGEHPDSARNIYGGKSMGAHLSKKYGGLYKSFGLSTHQGEYSCYVSYTNFSLTDCPLYNAPRGSFEEAMHTIALKLDAPMLFLDLSESRSLSWLNQPTPVRFANHVNIEYGFWTRYSVPYQFDGLFFVDQTTSALSYAR
ncbi:MAG: erythromycin esterase family protein [Saprospiraceae bacterium]|nr:erythromycin esterase family protein [Saprospiraceae bacterium]